MPPTAEHGLAVTGGRATSTGVAGYTLGGGDGWLSRAFGLACDNLLSVTLVTADGRTVRASESENPDLFWALHGGGGNFGVATEFEFRLYPLPENIYAGLGGLAVRPVRVRSRDHVARPDGERPGRGRHCSRDHHRSAGGLRTP